MPHPLAMPKPGQFTEECTIIRWLKKVGDPVAKGDILFEIETDKSNMEVESFFDGTLLKIIVPEGGTAPVQAIVGFVGQPGEAVPDVVPPPPKPAAPPATPAEAPAPKAPSATAAPVAVAPAAAAPSAPAQLRISPRARRLARESAVNPNNISGSGPGGRIVEKDVQSYMAARGYDGLRVSPAALALAVKQEVDILAVTGTGDDGRIRVSDVERAVKEKPRTMSRMRQVIAQRLTQSFTTTPHFFVTVSADITDLVALRREMKSNGLPYTVTDFVLSAVVRSLVEFPAFNSSTDGRTERWNGRVNLGLAVSLESGLVVPVIRNADGLSLRELHDAAAALADKARQGKLTPDEMSGSTFTISNMGMLDVENFTAIINPGEAGILAVSSARETPVAREGQIVVRTMMKMTVSADHRIIDGAVAARFINAIRAKLEEAAGYRLNLMEAEGGPLAGVDISDRDALHDRMEGR